MTASSTRSSGRSRSHHFIPRFHLRGFTPSASVDRLARFDKTTGTIQRPSVARSAVINDYYTLPAATGREPEELEHTFANLERIVAPWVQHFRSITEPGLVHLDAIARDGLAGYVAMLYMRSPVFREANRRLETFLDSIRIDMLLASSEGYLAAMRDGGDERTDADVEAERQAELGRFRSGEVYVEAHEQRSLAHLKIAVDQIRPILIELQWTLVRRENSPFLVLGDQPVTLLGPNGVLGGGFANDDVDVMVPLSSSCLLVMTREPHVGGVQVITPDRSRRETLAMPWWLLANQAAWRTSARFVFGRAAADLQATELSLDPSDRRSTLAGPSYDGGDPAWAAYAARTGIRDLYDEARSGDERRP